MLLVVTTKPSILMPHLIYFVREEGYNSAQPRILVAYSVTSKPEVRDFPSARQSHMIPSNLESSLVVCQELLLWSGLICREASKVIRNMGGFFFEDGVKIGAK